VAYYADFEETMDVLSDMFGEKWDNDGMAHQMLYISHYDRDISNDLRQSAYGTFTDYMENEYDLMWEDWFDWDAYREWYDSA
jgi:hypothetical protein